MSDWGLGPSQVEADSCSVRAVAMSMVTWKPAVQLWFFCAEPPRSSIDATSTKSLRKPQPQSCYTLCVFFLITCEAHYLGKPSPVSTVLVLRNNRVLESSSDYTFSENQYLARDLNACTQHHLLLVSFHLHWRNWKLALKGELLLPPLHSTTGPHVFWRLLSQLINKLMSFPFKTLCTTALCGPPFCPNF
jgi:hypothetical protein